MANYQAISELFKATIGEEKRAGWSPFFPVCENCGRIYSTRVTDADPASASIAYSCEISAPGRYQACGHHGTMSVLGGRCKVGWKVDWALRWFCLGVDYEMHGEDLLESARLSSKLVRLLGGEPPELFKYELFLDENGKKISKKIGNGISIEQWLRFAPVDSLLYIMFVKPQQAKKIGLPLLPEIVDQYLELVAHYDGSADSPVPFITRLSKGAHAGTLAGERVVTYSMIYELILALNSQDPTIVREFLLRYAPGIADNIGYYDQLIEDAMVYYREVVLPSRKTEEPDHAMDGALTALRDALAGLRGASAASDPEALQTAVFQVAKDRELKPKDWFRTLYRVFLRQPQGPRIGTLFALLGLEATIARLEAHLGSKS
jgi:lysyl-tRNA synthetase class 1